MTCRFLEFPNLEHLTNPHYSIIYLSEKQSWDIDYRGVQLGGASEAECSWKLSLKQDDVVGLGGDISKIHNELVSPISDENYFYRGVGWYR